MLASSRKAVASIPTILKANYSAAAAANGIQISSAKNGIKVASVQDSSATSGLAVVVNGGVKGEDSSNAGVSHFLKNYGFKVINTLLNNLESLYEFAHMHSLLEHQQPHRLTHCSWSRILWRRPVFQLDSREHCLQRRVLEGWCVC